MSKKPEIKYTYESIPRRGRQETGQEEYQLEDEAYAAMEDHRNSNQGDDGAYRFERKLDTLVTLMTQLVQQQQKGQRQSSRSPIRGDASHQGKFHFSKGIWRVPLTHKLQFPSLVNQCS